MFYLGAFDTTETDFGTVTIATAGKTSVTVTLSALTGTSADGTSAIFFHYPSGSAAVTSEDWTAATRLTDISQQGFAFVLQTALRSGANSNGWVTPTNITVQWRRTVSPYSYRIAYSSAVFSVTFSNAAGRQLMGFASLSNTTLTSYDGTLLPTYCINPTLPATSDPTLNFEPNGIANHIIADDGTGFGVSRYVAPLYRDWTQQFETAEKTERINAVAAHPWTFEDLFSNSRGETPFMVLDGFTYTNYELFSFRSEGTQWEPKRATPGNGSQFHIEFKTVVEGSISSAA